MRTKTPPETWRECPGCRRKLELNIANYRPHKTGRNGWNPRCRLCVTADNRVCEKRRQAKLAKIREASLPPLREGQRCPSCEGMGHRRPPTGCARCGLPYERELPCEIATRRSWSYAV